MIEIKYSLPGMEDIDGDRNITARKIITIETEEPERVAQEVEHLLKDYGTVRVQLSPKE